jgi:hypothetical protein
VVVIRICLTIEALLAYETSRTYDRQGIEDHFYSVSKFVLNFTSHEHRAVIKNDIAVVNKV